MMRYAVVLGMVAALLVACSSSETVDNTIPDNGQTEDLGRGDDLTLPDRRGEDDIPARIDLVVPVDVPDLILPDLVDVVDQVDDNGPSPETKDASKPEEVVEEGTKVKDIQQMDESKNCQVLYGSMLVGIDITLKSVVVAAPAYEYQYIGGSFLDGFYLMDAEGGLYSGIQATYEQDKMPALEPGMVVTVVGDHKEANCFTIFAVKSILIESEGNPPPEPYLTTPAEIMADPEAFEGVLVRIENVTVTNANPDALSGLDLQEFEVDETLRVGNDYDIDYMSPGTDARTEGDLFQKIVGVVRFKDEKYRLMPRFDSDLLLEGEEPPDNVVVEPMPDVVTSDIQDVVEEDIYYEVVEDVPVEDLPADLPAEEDVAPDVPTQDVQIEIPPEADSPIVITEIMYDVTGIPDDKGEWFELYNATDEPIDLNGWRLENSSGQMHVIMNGGPFPIQPGQAMVFGANAQESSNGGVELDYQYPWSDLQLLDTTDSVVVKNLYGDVVDSVGYDEFGGWPVAKGASLELIHPHLDNANPTYWQLATEPYGDETNLGTPGTVPLD